MFVYVIGFGYTSPRTYMNGPGVALHVKRGMSTSLSSPFIGTNRSKFSRRNSSAHLRLLDVNSILFGNACFFLIVSFMISFVD